MRKPYTPKRFIAVFLLVCMAVSMLSRSFAAHAEEETELRPDGSLPVVYLNIDESQGTIDDMIHSSDHSAYCYGKISIDVPEGFHYTDFPDTVCEDLQGMDMSIRGRGNSTWQRSAKKAFKIKLDKKTDIFGFGKNKHWVLLANALDDTLLRDRITAWLGDKLDFEFTPMGVPVDVVIKGEEYGEHYIGSYYLSENVRVDTNRLEIDELTEDDTEEPTITGGYLLQHGLQVDPWSPDRFFTERGVNWATHTPSFDVEGDNLTGGEDENEPVLEENYSGAELGDAYENPAQQTYIQNYMQMVEDTLFESGNAYRDLFDLRSAALYWWVQTLCLNSDGYGTGSYYVYKKRDVNGELGKLFTGPLWDFDFAWDNHDETEGFEVRHEWLTPMFCDREEGGFLEEVKKQWPLVRENAVKLIEKGGLIDQYYEETKTSAALDRQIWHPDQTDFNYKTEVDELKQWITDRIAWIDAHFDELDNVTHIITFMVDGEEYYVEYANDGSPAPADIKAPEKEGYVFLGWEDENGEIVPAEIKPVKDTVLNAKYLSDEEATHAVDIAFRKSSDVAAYNPNFTRYQIDYSVVPADAQDQVIEWSSSDESFATVDEEGIISYHDAGTVTITAKLRKGAERKFILTVTRDPVPVPESISPEEETVYMTVGEQKAVYITTEPDPAKIHNYYYKSEDAGIADADGYGVITANSPGKTVIHISTHTYGDPDGIELETDVTVIVSEKTEGPERIWFTADSYTIPAGNNFVLIPHTEPEDIDTKITFVSSDPSIVSNEGNLLTGRKPGTVTMTATAENGVSASCEIKVLFTDVPETGKYYSDPVYWAAGNGITNGYTDADGIIRTFKPQNSCTREAAVIFLWRLAGKPEPKSTRNPFSDVSISKYYYKAVLWAAENGITKGYSDGTFRPDETCLREHVVTFLWRYAEKPEPGVTKSPFNDVKASDYYYRAALWANEKGIAKGYSSGEHKGGFGPKLDCLREHVVTFLYRFNAEK